MTPTVDPRPPTSRRFLRTLGRVAGGYLMACLAVGLVFESFVLIGLMVGTMEFPEWRFMAGWMILFPIYIVGVASIVVAVLALIPATLLIIIGELPAIRSRALYMGFGVVVSLPSQLGFFFEMDSFRSPPAVRLLGLLFSGVALLAGQTCWRFAGRRAGE